MKNAFELDCEVQHLKHFFEGYRERVLTGLYGEQSVEDMGIDVQRYCPGSARQNSYKNGWEKAAEDLIGSEI